MLKIAFIMSALFMLSACYGPYNGKSAAPYAHAKHDGKYGHKCPPGHAKKGHC